MASKPKKAAAKAPGKKTSAGKLMQKAKTPKAAAAKPDLLAQTALDVEKLTEKQAHAEVMHLVEDIDYNSFRLGGVLTAIQEKQWFDGHESFRDLVQDKFGVHYRKAMYLVDIYKNLIEKEIPWKAVEGVGWSKLKDLASILTPKNAEAWAKKAKAMTVTQLIEAVKKAKASGKAGSDAIPTDTPKLKRLTFALHEDQAPVVREALDKVKKQTKTEHDTPALVYMCTGFLGGSVSLPDIPESAPAKIDVKAMTIKAKKELLAELMADQGYEVTLKVFEKVNPKIDLDVTVKE